MINIEDARRAARDRLPAPIYHYLEGGADDERTLQRNVAAFDEYELLPRYLIDVSRIDLRCRLLGLESAMPIVLAPTGMSRLFHHGRELAVARAAQRCGVPYTLSTMATTSIEEISAASNGPKVFQIYIFRDRGLTRELIARCRNARFDALYLTVDTPLAGNRERDRRTGMTIPPRFGLRSLLSFALHPIWTCNYVLHPQFKLACVAPRVDALRFGAMGVIEYVNSQFDRTVTWDDAAWLVREWGGPVAIKGLLSVEDAKQAASIGARAVVVSNHGGRQLDGVPAPIDCIAQMRAAVGDELDLILDGGVRRGTHIIKALCAGATACSIGRPYLYGLAAAGQPGVEGVLGMLKAELERDLALLGCPSVGALSESYLRHRAPA